MDEICTVEYLTVHNNLFQHIRNLFGNWNQLHYLKASMSLLLPMFFPLALRWPDVKIRFLHQDF